jgi:hypothetical protein
MASRLFALLDFLGCSSLMGPESDGTGPGTSLFLDVLSSARAKSPTDAPAVWLVTDSILVYDADPVPNAINFRSERIRLESFVWLCAMLVRESILRIDGHAQRPLRGAITCGEALVGPLGPLMAGSGAALCAAGRAVAEAHIWERSQKWIGSSVSPQSLPALQTDYSDQLPSVLRQNLLVEWEVPTPGGYVKTLAVNYVDSETAQRLQTTLRHVLDSSLGPEERRKYQESLRFIDELVAKRRFMQSLPDGVGFSEARFGDLADASI